MRGVPPFGGRPRRSRGVDGVALRARARRRRREIRGGNLPRPPARRGGPRPGDSPRPRAAGRAGGRLVRPGGLRACRSRGPGVQGGRGEHLAPIQAGGWGGDRQVFPGKRAPGEASTCTPGAASRFSVDAGPRPAIPSRHIWPPLPESQPSFSRSQEPPPPARGPAWGAHPGSGSGRRPPDIPHRAPVPDRAPPCPAPSPLTHCLRAEGARRLSGRWSCSSRSWRGAVGSRCRDAGSCQWKWGPPQVREPRPRRNSRPPAPQSALASKRRQLVLLKSLNLVPKYARANGTHRSQARSNGKAVGGSALAHAQLEAEEAGPSREAPPSSFCAARGDRKDAEAGGGPEAEPRSAGRQPPGRTWSCLPRMCGPAKLPSAAVGTGLRRVLISS